MTSSAHVASKQYFYIYVHIFLLYIMKIPRAPVVRIDKNPYIYGNYDCFPQPSTINFEATVDRRVKLMAEYLFPFIQNQSVLDIGCNTGFISSCYASVLGASSVLGVDIDTFLINRALEHIRHWKSNTLGLPISIKVEEPASKRPKTSTYYDSHSKRQNRYYRDEGKNNPFELDGIKVPIWPAGVLPPAAHIPFSRSLIHRASGAIREALWRNPPPEIVEIIRSISQKRLTAIIQLTGSNPLFQNSLSQQQLEVGSSLCPVNELSSFDHSIFPFENSTTPPPQNIFPYNITLRAEDFLTSSLHAVSGQQYGVVSLLRISPHVAASHPYQPDLAIWNLIIKAASLVQPGGILIFQPQSDNRLKRVIARVSKRAIPPPPRWYVRRLQHEILMEIFKKNQLAIYMSKNRKTPIPPLILDPRHISKSISEQILLGEDEDPVVAAAAAGAKAAAELLCKKSTSLSRTNSSMSSLAKDSISFASASSSNRSDGDEDEASSCCSSDMEEKCSSEVDDNDQLITSKKRKKPHRNVKDENKKNTDKNRVNDKKRKRQRRLTIEEKQKCHRGQAAVRSEQGDAGNDSDRNLQDFDDVDRQKQERDAHGDGRWDGVASPATRDGRSGHLDSHIPAGGPSQPSVSPTAKVTGSSQQAAGGAGASNFDAIFEKMVLEFQTKQLMGDTHWTKDGRSLLGRMKGSTAHNGSQVRIMFGVGEEGRTNLMEYLKSPPSVGRRMKQIRMKSSQQLQLVSALGFQAVKTIPIYRKNKKFNSAISNAMNNTTTINNLHKNRNYMMMNESGAKRRRLMPHLYSNHSSKPSTNSLKRAQPNIYSIIMNKSKISSSDHIMKGRLSSKSLLNPKDANHVLESKIDSSTEHRIRSWECFVSSSMVVFSRQFPLSERLAIRRWLAHSSEGAARGFARIFKRRENDCIFVFRRPKEIDYRNPIFPMELIPGYVPDEIAPELRKFLIENGLPIPF